MLEENSICKNCKSKLTGAYCSSCGEKTISNSDFSIKNILGQAFGAITNLDSKFLKSFVLLFRKPGKLSQHYIDGVRVPYLKPFQIFIICNLLFFIFLGDTDFFRTPSQWFFNSNINLYGKNILMEAETIMQKEGMSLEEVKFQYDRISSDLSKSLLVLLIPFIALVGILINRKMRFGKHLIFATHFFSFLLIFTTLLYLLSELLNLSNKWFFIIPVISVSLVYYIISIKTFYRRNLFLSTVYGIIGLLILGMFIGFYRNWINWLSLMLV